MTLRFKWWIYVLVFFTTIWVIISIKFPVFPSKYQGNTNEIVGQIRKVKINGDQIRLEVKAKEMVTATFYADSIEEKEQWKRVEIGEKVTLMGTLEKPLSRTVFHLFDYQQYLKSKGIHWILKVDSVVFMGKSDNILDHLHNFIENRIRNLESADYIRAFVLGDTSEMEQTVVDSYQKNGVSHLFAISGMHIGFISMILLFGIRKLFRNETAAYMITCFILFLYAVLTGMTPSVMRAVCGFFLIFCNKKLKWNLSSSEIILILACLFLLYRPYYLYSIGFLFSFTISFCLTLGHNILNRQTGYMKKLWVTSLLAFLASIPILVQNFFSINVLGIVYNLFFVPFVSFLLFPLSFLTLIFPFFDLFLSVLIHIQEVISLACANVSFGTITLCWIPLWLFFLSYAGIFLMIFQFEKKKYYSFLILILILIIHHFAPYFNPNSYLTMIDIGQGDSILIVLPHQRGNILIDTGGILSFASESWQKKDSTSIVESKTIPYLKSLGITHLDYLILTHGDYDHMGEANQLIHQYDVNEVIMNSGNNNELEQNMIPLLNKKNIPYQAISRKEIKISNVAFSFLNDQDKENENEDSLILFTKIENRNILLMGDAGKTSEEELIREYNLPKLDILKIGHHGSKNSTDDAILDQTMPELALISAGRKNRFSHPHQEVIDKLDERKIFYLVTSEVGSIEVNLNRFQTRTCYSRVH